MFDNIDANVAKPSTAAKVEPEEANSSSYPSIPNNLMEMPHENRTEFVESVQLHCKAVMERMRAVKESLNLPETSKRSQRSSDRERICDFSPEPTEGTKMSSSGLDAQDQGQKIREHVERIIDLVRSGKKVQFSDMRLRALEKPSYHVATNDAGKEPRQDTSLVVEEKTLKRENITENSVRRGSSCDSVEDTKLASAYSVLDGETLMGLSSKKKCFKVPGLKECGDGITHSASLHGRESRETDQIHSALSSKDCKELVKDILGEKQAALSISKIKKDIGSPTNKENQLTESNSIYDTFLDISFKNLDGFSFPPNQAHLRKLNDDSVVPTSSSQKNMPWSRRTEDPRWQMAVKIVRDVYVRIGCHENYFRYASWADEPNNTTVELGDTAMPCNCSLSHEKIVRLEGNDEDAENIDELSVNGIASTAFESIHSNKEEPGEKTCAIQTDQLEVASTNASCDAQGNSKMPVKRASLNHGQKKWAALKKRRKSFAFKRKESRANGTRKSLTLEKKTAEFAGNSYSEEGCSFENSENQPQKVRRQAADEERLTPLKEFISLKDSKTRDGEDIIVVNPSKIPNKRDFTGRKEYNEIMARLLLFVQEFTEERVKSEKFVIAVHAVKQRRSRLRSCKWATEFYKLLKNRYQNRLARCVFFKPSFKLRALVILSRPFVANDMREKIFIVKSKRKFSKGQGLRESDATEQTE